MKQRKERKQRKEKMRGKNNTQTAESSISAGRYRMQRWWEEDEKCRVGNGALAVCALFCLHGKMRKESRAEKKTKGKATQYNNNISNEGRTEGTLIIHDNQYNDTNKGREKGRNKHHKRITKS